MIKRWISNKVGSSLAMVLIAFLIIIVFVTSAFVISQANTRQVVQQDQGMDSYYIARSGAEATFEALLVTEPSLLTQFSGGSTSVLEQEIIFSEGVARVVVEGFTENSVRRVRITSHGSVSGTNVTRKSILEFNLSDYGNIKWSR